MTREERERWSRRYAEGEYDPRPEPSPLLTDCLEWLPAGRALDVATGAGRNALALAAAGHTVDAVDVARPALERARERATERGLTVNWVQADLDEFYLPRGAYDAVVVNYYVAMDLLPALKDALAPEGVLLYEHHLRSADPVARGPSSDRHRLRSNDLLRACLDLTVLRYEESVRETDRGPAAVASVLARNSRGPKQSYPPTHR